MKSFFNFFRNLVFILSLAVGMFFLGREIYFLDLEGFVSPLDKKASLMIRKDIYGEGHFSAARKAKRLHTGVDFLADIGTPVRATKGGWVIGAQASRGLGKYVKIYHGHNLISVYGHLDSIKVGLLQRLRQSDVIGTVGKTGNANYKKMLAHLHFEVIKNGYYLDPCTQLNNGCK